jgi:methylmalonyl-CoA/ethylmalonyl-CoA epimerase
MTSPALGTNVVVQVAIIVDDIKAKAAAWSEILGLPSPNISTTDTYDKSQATYNGQPTEARAHLAFFNLGQVSLELIEPIGEPSTWRDQLNQHGVSLHHIAFMVKGMQERIAYLEGHGLKLVQKGEYTGGRYAYIDAQDKLGCILELLEND